MIITSFLLKKERITSDNHPPIKLLAAYLFYHEPNNYPIQTGTYTPYG